MIDLQPFEPAERAYHDVLARLWSSACGSALAITPRLVAYNTRPSPSIAQAGCLAQRGGRPVGFVLASAAVGAPAGTPGWIDALAVVPDFQRQGAGSRLLTWAEAWLREQGCAEILLGGSLRPFTPGLPGDLHHAPFFERRGYITTGATWDVARRLRDYHTPASVPRNVDVRPAGPDDEPALREFMERAFPGRWAWECDDELSRGGRISDYTLLWDGGRVEGFCQITFEDSPRPIDRFYPRRLPRPWGQAGPLGVSAERRGRGYGAAVIDGGLRRLQAAGVDGCVIDWTNLLELYGKFGFQPYREFALLRRGLA